MTSHPVRVRVTVKALREQFEEQRFMDRMRSGEFRWQYKYNRHQFPPYPNRPWCTRSQILTWHDADVIRVASIHRLYHRTSRTYPDPKELLIDGVLYYV